MTFLSDHEKTHTISLSKSFSVNLTFRELSKPSILVPSI